ncbi:MAG TPA: ABC transporter permease subunit [Tepidisphaeraceae bacterium]|nr:ABC transporter permease subunit [Tepidisphaeraceae bacterium]
MSSDLLGALEITNLGGAIIGLVIVVFGLLVYGFRDLLRFSLTRAWAISSVCWSESIRRKVLWITPLAIVGVIIVAQLQRPSDEQDAIRQTIKFCLFATGLLIVITTIILAATNLPKEIDNRVIYTVVTKPTTRLEIVVGKIIGFARVSGAILLIMGIFTAGYLHLRASFLRDDIRQRLEAGQVSPTDLASYQHYREAGLLNAKTLEAPKTMEIYARLPEPGSNIRWFNGNSEGEAMVPFEFTKEEFVPPDDPQGVAGKTGALALIKVGYEQVGPTEQDRTSKLPIGVAAPSTGPTTKYAGKTIRPPQVLVRVFDQNANQLLPANMVGEGKAIDLADPMGTIQIPVYISPQGIGQIISTGHKRIYINIAGPTKGFQYSVGPDAVTLVVPGEKPETPARVIPQAYASKDVKVNHPVLRGRYGLGGEQLPGKSTPDGSVAIMAFHDAPPSTSSKGVPFMLRVGIERSGDDEALDKLTQVEAVAFNTKTGETGEPTKFFVEANRQSIFDLPRQQLEGGDFEIRIRNLTDGHYLILKPDALSMVQSLHSFDFNLLKSLLILWLMSILVTIIAIFCSTFLSWPIAIVLTLVILLGHWGVQQLSDSLSPGTGNSIAQDLGFQDPGKAKAFTSTYEALARSLTILSSILPDISQFSAAEDIEKGVSISSQRLADAAMVLFAFGLPMLALSYVLLRNKEVAP